MEEQACLAGALFRDLGGNRDEAACLGIQTYSIEQYGFADAAQTMQDEAAGGTAGADSVECDGSPLDDIVAAGKFGRRCSRAWCIRILTRVHAIASACFDRLIIAMLSQFIKIRLTWDKLPIINKARSLWESD